jgi:hypothetical protein
MPLFEDNKVYRTNDIEGPGKLCPNPATRKSWTQDFDFPPGRLMGRFAAGSAGNLTPGLIAALSRRCACRKASAARSHALADASNPNNPSPEANA